MGSILTTPSRRGYSKTGSGNRMKISEKNTWKRGVDYGIQQARAGIAKANEGSRQAQEAINIINSPPEQAGKGKRPLVFVGDKQWDEYQHFNKRKRYND